MNYSDRLRELREEKFLTLKEVASNLHISRSVYGKYESEYEIIPIKHLIAVTNYFNVSIDYLFGFTKNMHYSDIEKEADRKKMGSRLKELRKENNLTQSKLASILNTFQQVIANYENGKNLIATPFLYTICKKYNISADYLLGRIDTNTLKNSLINISKGGVNEL